KRGCPLHASLQCRIPSHARAANDLGKLSYWRSASRETPSAGAPGHHQGRKGLNGTIYGNSRSGMAFAFSTNRRAIRIKTVLWGLGLQFAFAVFVIKIEVGRLIFQVSGDLVKKLLDNAFAGSSFVFGELGVTRHISFHRQSFLSSE